MAMSRIRRLMLLVFLSAALGTGVLYGFKASGNPSSCPGRIVCPLTGKLICRDACPITK